MTPLIILLLIVAVIVLFTHTSSNREATEQLQRRADELSQRLARAELELQHLKAGRAASPLGVPGPTEPLAATAPAEPGASEMPAFEPPPIQVMGEPLESVLPPVAPSVVPRSTAVPPPLPPIIPTPLSPAPLTPAPLLPTPLAAETTPPAMPVGMDEPKSLDPLSARATVPAAIQKTTASDTKSDPVAPKQAGSFEMRLGMYWFVRLGIVSILTGLVFLGTFAYKNWVHKLGAGGKVALLYLASGALLAVRTWLFRREKQETVKNYAQVLFAGGLAAVYFTTYAAHWLPNLRVIESPLVDGALLLAWAGYIVWLADRRKSEVLALFAIGLAYYTSFITNVGAFTLYSNLVLTTAAVFFLVRNRWAALSAASLVATYAGYAFWRFYHHGATGPLDEGELWMGNGFLSAYWALFTAAAFLSRSELLAGAKRAAFASLNNGAFFALVLSSMFPAHEGQFWKFSLGFGAAQLALAALARRCLAAEPSVKNAYLTQGVLLVTVGFIAKFTGLNLALVLAAESVVLSVLGRQQGNIILLAGSLVAAFLSVCWGVADVREFEHAGLLAGAAVGAMLLFDAWWSARSAGPDDLKQDSSPAYFTTLALVMWAITTSRNTTPEWRGLVYAIESTAFLLASRPLRNPTLGNGSYPFAIFATAWVLWSIKAHDTTGLVIGVATGALLLANSFAGREPQPGVGPQPRGWRSFFFTALALCVWFCTTWRNTDTEFRALLIALESMAFVVAGSHLASVPLVVGGRVFGALAVAAASVFLALRMDAHTAVSMAVAWPHALAGALLLGNALIERQALAHAAISIEMPVTGSGHAGGPPVSPVAHTSALPVTGFTGLALLLWMGTTWCCAPGEWRAPLLAGEALLFTASLPLLRLTELTLFGQAFLLLAHLNCAVLLTAEGTSFPRWNPVVVIAVTVALGHWWQRSRENVWLAQAQRFFLGAFALAATALLHLSLHPQFTAPHWLAFASLLAVAITVYGALTGAWFLAIGGQFFLAVGIYEFLRQLYTVPASLRPEWFYPLAPIAALTTLSFAALAGLARANQAKTELGEKLTVVTLAYRVIASALGLLWVFSYIPTEDRFWFLALVGAGFFALGGWRRSREALLMGTVFTLSGFLVFVSELGRPAATYWANLPAILLLLVQQRVARLMPERYPVPAQVHTAAIITGGCGAWLFISSWVTLKAGGFGFYLTASWAALALVIFVAGFACRERVYRWHGLAVLACAIGRVVLFDVWKLETIYRILSFMALGVVLLVLGFIYNKYEAKIKEWL